MSDVPGILPLEVPMSELVSVGGSIFSTLLAGRIATSQTRWARRRASGTEVLASLTTLHRLLGQWDIETDVNRWRAAVISATGTISSERSVMPRQWAHLEGSVRAAVSESTGLGYADRMTANFCHEAFDPDRIWIDFAADYFAYLITRVGHWREESSTRHASRAQLSSFDQWLQESGRYAPGLGLSPVQLG
jgi:hypothetical protein